MANNCNTDYSIIGKKKHLQLLLDVLKDDERKQQTDQEYRFPTLRQILCELGFSPSRIEAVSGNKKGILCDHTVEVEDTDTDEIRITLYCSTKWDETTAFRRLLRKKFPKATIFYKAEEPGLGTFKTNDPEYDGLYVVFSPEGKEYCDDNRELIWLLEDVLGKTFVSLKDAMNALKAYNELNTNRNVRVERFSFAA